MTKPPKYYNQVRIPAGMPTDFIFLTETMNQNQWCSRLNRSREDSCDPICGDIINCNDCMFDHRNKRHFTQWKKETFKGVKRCKKMEGK